MGFIGTAQGRIMTSTVEWTSAHCSETKFNPNLPQLTSSLQIIISYIYTCHFKKNQNISLSPLPDIARAR